MIEKSKPSAVARPSVSSLISWISTTPDSNASLSVCPSGVESFPRQCQSPALWTDTDHSPCPRQWMMPLILYGVFLISSPLTSASSVILTGFCMQRWMVAGHSSTLPFPTISALALSLVKMVPFKILNKECTTTTLSYLHLTTLLHGSSFRLFSSSTLFFNASITSKGWPSMSSLQCSTRSGKCHL